MNLDESKTVLIQVEEAYRQIPVTLRTGLPALFTALELASSLRPALEETERARLALLKVIEGVQAAEATRQTNADAVYEAAEAVRRSTLTDLDGKVETARQTLSNLDGLRAEAEATITQAEQARVKLRETAAAL